MKHLSLIGKKEMPSANGDQPVACLYDWCTSGDAAHCGGIDTCNVDYASGCIGIDSCEYDYD